MKIVIWGTGKYYSKFIKYFTEEEILFIVDNDKTKHNLLLNGKMILEPQRIKDSDFDYIVILVKRFEIISKQLIEMGVSDERIKCYKDIATIKNIEISVQFGEQNLGLFKWLNSSEGKNIFLCTHNFSRSGVPVAMMNLAVLLRSMGNNVLLGGAESGTLTEELSKHEIPYIEDVDIIQNSDIYIATIREYFELVIIGSIVLAEFGTAIARCEKPVIWWLHESEPQYYTNYQLPKRENIFYYAGGRRVQKIFEKNTEGICIKNLLYFLPEYEQQIHTDKSEAIVFALIGYVCRRKAQDILIEAIKSLSVEEREKACFYFVGQDSDELDIDWKKLNSEIPQIIKIDELTQEELCDFYKELDYLVCPSRDDPMPIVVTQAFQYGILSIVSDQVGQSEYITDERQGFVVQSENIEELTEKVKYCIMTLGKRRNLNLEARHIYDTYFSESVMKHNIKEIIEEVTRYE